MMQHMTTSILFMPDYVILVLMSNKLPLLIGKQCCQLHNIVPWNRMFPLVFDTAFQFRAKHFIMQSL